MHDKTNTTTKNCNKHITLRAAQYLNQRWKRKRKKKTEKELFHSLRYTKYVYLNLIENNFQQTDQVCVHG